MKLFLLYFFLYFNLYPENFSRLDPHGKDGIVLKEYKIEPKSNCLVCHELKNGKLSTLPSIDTKCITCHNPLPHSGLAEHLGKDLSKLQIGLEGKLNCLSCHRPHRSKLVHKKEKDYKIFKREKPSFVLEKRKTLTLPAGMVERKTPNPMIERDCLDCHSLEKMP